MTDFGDNNCYFGAIAVAFVCGGAQKGLLATATSTVSAGKNAIPTAAGGSGSGASGSSPTSGAANAGTTGTGSGKASSPSSSSPNNSSPTQSTSSGSNNSASSGPSKTLQIALGIGIPVVGVIVALLAWLCPRQFRRSRQNGPLPLSDYERPKPTHYPSSTWSVPSYAQQQVQSPQISIHNITNH